MALMDKLKGEFVDIIEWNEDGTDTVAWRFPRYQDEIKNGAQLTVRPSQTAVFVNEGKVADVFPPGRHTLDTRNLPMLSTMRGWKYGFDSPFKAEVYFVSTRHFPGLKWGTKNPVMMRDPELGPVRLRAFGSFIVHVTDPAYFVARMTGTRGEYDLSLARDQLRDIVVAHASDVLGSANLPVLDLASNYDELATRLSREVVSDFAQLGFAPSQIIIENISLPEEVEKAIDKRGAMGAVGNLDGYAKFQAANAMEAAAKNPGGAGQVMGLGVGMGLAGHLAGSLSAPTAAAGGPPPLPGKEWWVGVDGQQQGPLDLSDLAALIAAGKLTPASLAWRTGQSGWLPMTNLAELSVLFPTATR